jgi:hypothetical protein
LSLWLVRPTSTTINLKKCSWETISTDKDARGLNIMAGTMMTVSTSERPKKSRKGTTTTAAVMIKTIKNKKNHMKSKRVSMSSSSNRLSLGIKH